MKKIHLYLTLIFASVFFAAHAADPEIAVYFCAGKGENCEPIGHKGTWDVDDANKCKVLIEGKNLKGKKLTVKIFREGRAATKSKIDDMFTIDIEGSKVCQILPFKFEARGDYYVKVFDEDGEEIGKGHVDMEEDMF
ncbi:MAG: hypothetical protein JNK66_04010 [Chitinophagales bacterium]|nr:hypothetical protein [Chitinophagales bacterium]